LAGSVAAREGTPSIVYDVSGLRDVVENLTTGIILPRNNPETMAQEAIQLYSDKKAYKQMQENCYRWAASFKWDRETEKSYLFLKKYILKK
jgi:glycosyltransferase involved in cell wall biosynthesis